MFRQFPAQVILKPTLYGGAADPFPTSQTAAIYAIVMRYEYAPSQCFAGSFPQQDSRKPLPKTAPALPAFPLAALQFQHTMSQSPALMPRPPRSHILAPQPLALTMRA